MKKLLGIILAVVMLFSCTCTGTVSAATGNFSKSGKEFVKNIGAGWNLGNTFENYKLGVGPLEQESCTYNPTTQKGMIDLVANTGYNAIRIPVSWGPQTTYSNGTYTVNSVFISRLKEVISWCYSYNMYVIINMHHDDQNWLNISASDSQWSQIKEQYKQTWQQIATAFKDYDEHLIFEAGNEMIATASFDGCGSGTGKCWWGHSQKSFDRQNELYKIFYEVVRSSGGNNGERYIMFPTYGAQWYTNQLHKLYLPYGDKNVIVDIHWYSVSDQLKVNTINVYANGWINHLHTQNLGVVIGECGFNYATSTTTKLNWANTFVKHLRQNLNIPVFIWDDGGNMRWMDRKPQSDGYYSWDSDGTYDSVEVAFLVASISNEALYGSDNDEENPDPDKIVQGDINKDGIFKVSDVLFYIRYLEKNPSFFRVIGEMPETGDMNADGEYNVKDVFIMRKQLAW